MGEEAITFCGTFVLCIYGFMLYMYLCVFFWSCVYVCSLYALVWKNGYAEHLSNQSILNHALRSVLYRFELQVVEKCVYQ